MGIDVYLEWDNMTKADKEARFTGFSVEHGHVGYLREAYHGGPYATAYLITEPWESQPEDGFRIKAVELKRRLPSAVMASMYRHHIVYGERLDSPGYFEASDEKAYTKELSQQLRNVFASLRTAQDRPFQPNEEQIKAVTALIEKRELPKYALSFVDFVALAEKQEHRTGKPCRVVVSY